MIGGILMVLMFLVALFLILLVLVQRGRGGGLAGAFGGMGGQSAFGTKAGDLFTRITIVAAAVWILLCVLGVKYYNTDDSFSTSLGGAAKITVAPGPSGDSSPAPTGPASDAAPAAEAPATEAPAADAPADDATVAPAAADEPPK